MGSGSTGGPISSPTASLRALSAQGTLTTIAGTGTAHETLICGSPALVSGFGSTALLETTRYDDLVMLDGARQVLLDVYLPPEPARCASLGDSVVTRHACFGPTGSAMRACETAVFSSETSFARPVRVDFGLPRHNADFGRKAAVMGLRDAVDGHVVKVVAPRYEVFFPLCVGQPAPAATYGCVDTAGEVVHEYPANHPTGDSDWPNWFNYWSEVADAADIVYGGQAPVSTYFGAYDWDGAFGYPMEIVVWDTVVILNLNTPPCGGGGKAGLDGFGQVVLHEKKHRELWHWCWPDVNGDGIHDYDWTRDLDGDYLCDEFEEVVGPPFDWSDPYSIFPGPPTTPCRMSDDEVLPTEAATAWSPNGHNAADWANPGKNDATAGWREP